MAVTTPTTTSLAELGARAKAASRLLATTSTAAKDAALHAAADALVAATDELLVANARDVAREEAAGMAAPLLDRLTPQLDAKPFLGPSPLILELRAFQFQPRMIPIERLLERGDDHSGEPRFDRSGQSVRHLPRRRRRIRLRRIGSWPLESPGDVSEDDERVECLEET